MTFLEALTGPRPLVMDAAMGTALLAAGVRSVSAAPGTHPEWVRSIHAAHVAAGAEVVLTCTFQYDPDAHAVAADLARAAGPRFVLADIGPWYGASGEELDERALAPRELVDGYLLETWSSPVALRAAERMARQPAPVLLSLAYRRDTTGALVTRSGHPPEYYARAARQHGIAAVGVNCGRDIGLSDVIEVLRRYRETTDLPLFARPNAGAPGPNGKYPLTPEALAEAVPELLAAGARMLGGCCGTTAAHVAAVARVLRQ